MHDQPKCPVCGTQMIQKSRARLLVVGFCMISSISLAFLAPALWVPSVIAALSGIFLVIWATAGKGRWCRQCKTFRVG